MGGSVKGLVLDSITKVCVGSVVLLLMLLLSPHVPLTPLQLRESAELPSLSAILLTLSGGGGGGSSSNNNNKPPYLAVVRARHNQWQARVKACPVDATVVTFQDVLDNRIATAKQISLDGWSLRAMQSEDGQDRSHCNGFRPIG